MQISLCFCNKSQLLFVWTLMPGELLDRKVSHKVQSIYTILFLGKIYALVCEMEIGKDKDNLITKSSCQNFNIIIEHYISCFTFDINRSKKEKPNVTSFLLSSDMSLCYLALERYALPDSLPHDSNCAYVNKHFYINYQQLNELKQIVFITDEDL